VESIDETLKQKHLRAAERRKLHRFPCIISPLSKHVATDTKIQEHVVT